MMKHSLWIREPIRSTTRPVPWLNFAPLPESDVFRSNGGWDKLQRPSWKRANRYTRDHSELELSLQEIRRPLVGVWRSCLQNTLHTTTSSGVRHQRRLSENVSFFVSTQSPGQHLTSAHGYAIFSFRLDVPNISNLVIAAATKFRFCILWEPYWGQSVMLRHPGSHDGQTKTTACS